MELNQKLSESAFSLNKLCCWIFFGCFCDSNKHIFDECWCRSLKVALTWICFTQQEVRGQSVVTFLSGYSVLISAAISTPVDPPPTTSTESAAWTCAHTHVHTHTCTHTICDRKVKPVHTPEQVFPYLLDEVLVRLDGVLIRRLRVELPGERPVRPSAQDEVGELDLLQGNRKLEPRTQS